MDTSSQTGEPLLGPFGRGPIPVPFRVWNLTEQKWATFAIVERLPMDSTRYDHVWQPTEPILVLVGDSAGVEPVYPDYKVAWAVRLFPPEDASITPRPPGAGDLLRITTAKPFRHGETLRFTTRSSSLDTTAAKRGMDDIYVVPNPYVATSTFEPTNVYKSGRGARRIYFMNLPEECDISIYTKRGYLVDTLKHLGSGTDGQESWDLVSRDGMNIAYGIYFYVVEAYGEQAVGKFAIIK